MHLARFICVLLTMPTLNQEKKKLSVTTRNEIFRPARIFTRKITLLAKLDLNHSMNTTFNIYGLFTHDCYSGDNVMALKSARNRQSISRERKKTRAKQFSAINACARLESAACLLDYVNAVLGRNLPPRK